MSGAIFMLAGITAVAWFGYWLHLRAVRADEAEHAEHAAHNRSVNRA